jgi:hypothetical protein
MQPRERSARPVKAPAVLRGSQAAATPAQPLAPQAVSQAQQGPVPQEQREPLPKEQPEPVAQQQATKSRRRPTSQY